MTSSKMSCLIINSNRWYNL